MNVCILRMSEHPQKSRKKVMSRSPLLLVYILSKHATQQTSFKRNEPTYWPSAHPLSELHSISEQWWADPFIVGVDLDE
jgi:hypothetical protein